MACDRVPQPHLAAQVYAHQLSVLILSSSKFYFHLLYCFYLEFEFDSALYQVLLISVYIIIP